ncbi:glycosyltransferase family 4 protein [Desulforudis sp. Tu-874]|uniref:glycosyltransferase family 4 protein n=1 Tax=Desulforudis sp. Tu-874 TaxID=3416276 RepID=UPI003CE49561
MPGYRGIKKILDGFRPDLVHIATPFGLGLCGLRYARAGKLPAVTSCHTNFDVYLRYYRLAALHQPLWKFLTWFHRQYDLTLCPSQATRDKLAARGIKNLRFWVRGVDSDLFTPQNRSDIIARDYGVAGKMVLLYVYVGRVAAEKNLDVLLEAFDLLDADYPGGLHLFIVGDGPMMQRVRAWARPGITCTGYLTGQPLRAMYASSDIFVFPSMSETFGNVVLEAMASGLPVVAPFSEGLKDNLINGVNSLVCAPHDPVGFAADVEQAP